MTCQESYVMYFWIWCQNLCNDIIKNSYKVYFNLNIKTDFIAVITFLLFFIGSKFENQMF